MVWAESSHTLLGEIFSARALEKSAEVVVAKIATEKWKEQRTEGQAREQPNQNLNKQARMERSETQRTQQLRWLSYEANIRIDAGERQQRWEWISKFAIKRKEEVGENAQ